MIAYVEKSPARDVHRRHRDRDGLSPAEEIPRPGVLRGDEARALPQHEEDHPREGRAIARDAPSRRSPSSPGSRPRARAAMTNRVERDGGAPISRLRLAESSRKQLTSARASPKQAVLFAASRDDDRSLCKEAPMKRTVIASRAPRARLLRGRGRGRGEGARVHASSSAATSRPTSSTTRPASTRATTPST